MTRAPTGTSEDAAASAATASAIRIQASCSGRAARPDRGVGRSWDGVTLSAGGFQRIREADGLPHVRDDAGRVGAVTLQLSQQVLRGNSRVREQSRVAAPVGGLVEVEHLRVLVIRLVLVVVRLILVGLGLLVRLVGVRTRVQIVGQEVRVRTGGGRVRIGQEQDRKSTRLNSSHVSISYAVFCLKKKKKDA